MAEIFEIFEFKCFFYFLLLLRFNPTMLTGGSGPRSITVITPESESCTGALMQTASNSGKLVLYIVPLQLELDLTPLPLNSY